MRHTNPYTLVNVIFSWLLRTCLLLNLVPFFSYSQEFDRLLEQSSEEGLTVNLREPTYANGILSTQKGGLISAPQLRVQAMQLCYTHQKTPSGLVWTIEAEGDLIVEFGEYVFVGKTLSYDLSKKEGVITWGRTAVPPWFFGGEKLELKADGSYLITNGYVTTSEKDVPDWSIHSKTLMVDQAHDFKAQNVHVEAYNYTILWVPSLKANLDSIFDNPIRYRFRWGGRQGPRFGLTYEFFSWEHWKMFFRFDYRLTRGPGGGIETRYRSEDRKTEFQSINYLAKDSSILHPHEKARFRFEGSFKKKMDEDKTSILLTYDKISDKDMPSSYYDRDFDFDTAERTQLLIRREELQWIGTFNTRIRINSFQTVKQELPTLEVNFKPLALNRTGIIFENLASASYLNFEYSKFLLHARDYSSTRFQYFPTLYRPIVFGPFLTMTPEIGMVAIIYGNSQTDEGQWLALGKGGIKLQTHLHRFYGPYKHVIEPYAAYRYYSSPTSSPHQHYIFDLSDGWTRLNYLSFGINNAWYAARRDACVMRLYSADFYAHAFFHTNKLTQAIPRVYGRFSLFSLPTLKHTVHTAWNLEHRQIDHFNFHTQWTYSSDFAMAFEFRHRDSFCWRKVDKENFFLDVFRSEGQLRHSPESDRRDTLLVHFFYRFHPNWSCEVTTRQGWNRIPQPKYVEFEIDLLTTIQTAWHLRFSYQHQENDDRVAMFLNIGLSKPEPLSNQQIGYRFD